MSQSDDETFYSANDTHYLGEPSEHIYQNEPQVGPNIGHGSNHFPIPSGNDNSLAINYYSSYGTSMAHPTQGTVEYPHLFSVGEGYAHLAPGPSTVDPSRFLQTNTININPHNCDIDIKKARVPVKPTNLLNLGGSSGHSEAKFDGGPWEMCNQLKSQEPDDQRDKNFTKQPKDKVSSERSRNASILRRTSEARFICPFEGCNGSFTRKHNLNNHLKAHCGITDNHCPICERAFTTLPVLNRHFKTCERKHSDNLDPANIDGTNIEPFT